MQKIRKGTVTLAILNFVMATQSEEVGKVKREGHDPLFWVLSEGLTVSFNDFLIDYIDIKSCASLSLVSKTCAKIVDDYLTSFSLGGAYFRNILGKETIKFYTLLGRLIVPFEEKKKRWNILPLFATYRCAPFCVLIGTIIKGRIVNNPRFISYKNENNYTEDDYKTSWVFCGHNEKENEKIATEWTGTNLRMVVVSSGVIIQPYILPFIFPDDLDVRDIHRRREDSQFVSNTRKRCLFYVYRSEWLLGKD